MASRRNVHCDTNHAEATASTIQCLCDTVKDMGARMDGRFAEEAQKRQQENQILKTEVREEALLMKTELCTRKDEELHKEEKARQMVQKDLMTIREKFRSHFWLKPFPVRTCAVFFPRSRAFLVLSCPSVHNLVL